MWCCRWVEDSWLLQYDAGNRTYGEDKCFVASCGEFSRLQLDACITRSLIRLVISLADNYYPLWCKREYIPHFPSRAKLESYWFLHIMPQNRFPSRMVWNDSPFPCVGWRNQEPSQFAHKNMNYPKDWARNYLPSNMSLQMCSILILPDKQLLIMWWRLPRNFSLRGKEDIFHIVHANMNLIKGVSCNLLWRVSEIESLP